MTEGSYKIRPVQLTEHPFILSTFINAHVKNCVTNLRENRCRWNAIPSVFRCLPMDLLCSHYHGLMTRHLYEGECLVVGEETDVLLLGYVVFSRDPNMLFWMYLKPDFRGYDVEKDLIDACNFDPSKPVFLPYRNSMQVRLLKSCGLHE